MDDLTHVNEQGRARMVDVSAKERTQRMARACGRVRMAPSTLELVRTGGSKKGDVLAVAQVAAVMAAKRCWEIIPMCHPIALTGVDVNFSLTAEAVEVEATCRCVGETGVEMEALAAVSAACLTIYDMLKAHQRDMVIEEVLLAEKDGGRSGHFVPERSGRLSDCTAAAPMAQGTVVAVSLSEHKGTRKHTVDAIELQVGHGVVGDAHAGAWHRQVSLLPEEAMEAMRDALPTLAAGDFAENILTSGLDLKTLPIGSVLHCGTATLVLTQIGKKCHTGCEITKQTGSCVMPTEGIFCVVVAPGCVHAGDTIDVLNPKELAS